MAYQGTSLILPGSLTTSQTEGIIGTTTNNDADLGSVGEFVYSAVESGSAVSLVTQTPKNVTSISLTAGDWEVWGSVGFLANSATSVLILGGWINDTSATAPNNAYVVRHRRQAGGTVYGIDTTPFGAPTPSRRFSLSTTTTIYLSVLAFFSLNTCTAIGTISARRIR